MYYDNIIMMFDNNKYYRNGYIQFFGKLMIIVGISLSGNPGGEVEQKMMLF